MMRGKILQSRLLVATVLLFPVLCGAEPLPPAGTIEEARERLRVLSEPTGRIDAWVEENWGTEFEKRNPNLSRAPRARGETEQTYRVREMQARMAVSELKASLRKERKEWLEAERQALLGRTIRENLTVRLGPYDPDRIEYPLLLGFGWPAGLAIRIRVPEKESAFFARKFPGSLPASFRVNEKEDAYLLSIDRGGMTAEVRIDVMPPSPRLLWHASHESWVTSVGFHPDGSQLATSGGDGAVCVWDAETGTRLFRLEDVEMALSIAYSPDGSVLATGGTDSLLRLRDAGTGKEIWRAQAGGMVFSVAFSPDGRYIATGDDGGTLRVWNVSTGKEILRADLGGAVRAVAFTPSGRTIAAGGEGKFAILWNVASGRQVWRKELGWPVLSISAGAGGLIAVGGGEDRILALREEDGMETWSGGVGGEPRAVQFDAQGRLLCVGAGYTAGVFLARTGERNWSVSVGSPVRSVAFAPTGAKLAVGSADFGVRMFEVDEGDRLTAAFWKYGRIYIDRARVKDLFK